MNLRKAKITINLKNERIFIIVVRNFDLFKGNYPLIMKIK